MRLALHQALSCNELVFGLNEELRKPQPLEELPETLEQRVGRPVTEAEILAWLTLGAAARREGRPLLRPMVHGFVRGIGGAVVTFPEDTDGARLWLAAEDQARHLGPDGNDAHFPVTTCTTCGQHYYVAFLKDFEFTRSRPGGGEAGPGGRWWPSLEETLEGKRVLLIDHLIGADDGETLPTKRTTPLHFCRKCGTAHPQAVPRCLSCGAASSTIRPDAIRQSRKNPGFLTSCLSCGSTARPVNGRYREPARPVRAINVSDVHVLTQDMVHQAQRRRLLVFCDNRQDAAFQAGWMKDHARRFRLRALMAEGIRERPRSVGDLVAFLDDLLEADETLSRALIPEVWEVVRRESAGGRHWQERRKYLRFQVLREVTLTARQALGLEPWGRMKVEYDGLEVSLPWIQERAHALAIPPERLREGIAGVLDYLRRKGALYDPEHEIFTKHWMEGDREIQQGYLPGFLRPHGTKLRRAAAERKRYTTQWLSDRGDTTLRQVAGKWGVAREDVESFLENLFDFLVRLHLLVPVRLKGSRGRPLPNLQGIFQVNADRLRLSPNRGVKRCRSCRRKTTRDVPYDRCPAWRCQGVLEWVPEDADVTDPAALRAHVDAFVDRLEAVVARLRRRLRWALNQIRRLNERRVRQGTLDAEDEALFRRCDKLVKRLKGTIRRSRTRAEGHDDFNTFNVLAAEGFLPGYGLEAGSVIGGAEIPFWRMGAMDFSLPRPPATALREYVPGILIYANGHRFVARRFHRELAEEHAETPYYEVSPERQAVKAGGATGGSSLTGQLLQTISVCDTDLIHTSHISDEEELRFQLGVAVYGLELGQHSGGRAFRWGPQPTHLRRGVRMRLVNVGASGRLKRTGKLGFPVCLVCGQSVSPLSSQRQRSEFRKSHAERCGRSPNSIGFHADVTADVLSLSACDDATTAYSVLEALRFGAAHVLDMHLDDLQILVIGHVDRDEVDALLWDPMAAGSGLLDQICERFGEVAKVAREVADNCPAVCGSSCIDCLQTFRNAYYHSHLNRGVAIQRFRDWGRRLTFAHDIPPLQPEPTPDVTRMPVNEAETKLRRLLLAAGFAEGSRGEQLRLGPALGTTTPDVIYRAEDDEPDEGLCIYLDGLSGHLHGNPETAEQDRRIRTWLRNSGYDVLEISDHELGDENAMAGHFRRLAGYLGMRDVRRKLRRDRSWFRDPAAGARSRGTRLRLVTPSPDSRYVNCLPLVPLAAAAGAFGDPHTLPDESDWEWVEFDTVRPLRSGMFVARVVGQSMEPMIPDGSYCLFRSPVTGTRQGRTVLVQLRDAIDPDTDQRFTVKRYRSEKTTDEDGWRHFKIVLEPVNPDFQPIELTADDEDTVAVVAELVEVIGSSVTG